MKKLHKIIRTGKYAERAVTPLQKPYFPHLLPVRQDDITFINAALLREGAEMNAPILLQLKDV